MAEFKRLSEVYGMKVYTEDGEFYGEIKDAIIVNNKIVGWKIAAIPGSVLRKKMKNIEGVIVQQRFVKSIKDIMIISSAMVPIGEEEKE